MRLVARGSDNLQIAAHLGLSDKTVRNSLSRLYGKLGVEGRPMAVVRTRELGLANPQAGSSQFGTFAQPQPGPTGRFGTFAHWASRTTVDSMEVYAEIAMFVPVAQATLYCNAYGPVNAPAIVGAGGWIGSGELWALPFETLSQNWRTLRYDHRGTGASVAEVDSITLPNMVNDVFAVMDAHGIQRCVLAAESSGALTALSAALQRPERISGLVLVDGMVFRGLDAATDPFLQGLQHAYSATLDHFVNLCMPKDGPAHIKRWGRQIINLATPEAAIALRARQQRNRHPRRPAQGAAAHPHHSLRWR